MIISGVALIRDTGCNSSTASCAAGYIAPAPTWLAPFPMLGVLPAGAAWAARGGPLPGPAPGPGPGVTGGPSGTPPRAPTPRARGRVTGGGPAGNGTIMVMGCDG